MSLLCRGPGTASVSLGTGLCPCGHARRAGRWAAASRSGLSSPARQQRPRCPDLTPSRPACEGGGVLSHSTHPRRARQLCQKAHRLFPEPPASGRGRRLRPRSPSSSGPPHAFPEPVAERPALSLPAAHSWRRGCSLNHRHGLCLHCPSPRCSGQVPGISPARSPRAACPPHAGLPATAGGAAPGRPLPPGGSISRHLSGRLCCCWWGLVSCCCGAGAEGAPGGRQ